MVNAMQFRAVFCLLKNSADLLLGGFNSLGIRRSSYSGPSVHDVLLSTRVQEDERLTLDRGLVADQRRLGERSRT